MDPRWVGAERSCLNPAVSLDGGFGSKRCAMKPESWTLNRRADGAVLVRVHSRSAGTATLPDAVFSFRAGDPQYRFWERQFRMQQLAASEQPNS
jgi:hypothetical protein